MQDWHKNFEYNIRWNRNETWFKDYSNTETFDYFPYKPSSQTSQTLDQNLTRDWDEAESIASFSIKYQTFSGFYAQKLWWSRKEILPTIILFAVEMFFKIGSIIYCWLFNPTWEGVQIPWIGGGGAKSAPPLRNQWRSCVRPQVAI